MNLKGLTRTEQNNLPPMIPLRWPLTPMFDLGPLLLQSLNMLWWPIPVEWRASTWLLHMSLPGTIWWYQIRSRSEWGQSRLSWDALRAEWNRCTKGGLPLGWYWTWIHWNHRDWRFKHVVGPENVESRWFIGAHLETNQRVAATGGKGWRSEK